MCRYPQLMKSLLKISSLFALIIAGRYMQLTAPAATAGLAEAPKMLFVPRNTNAMTLTNYSQEPINSVITPVSQRKQETLSVTWF